MDKEEQAKLATTRPAVRPIVGLSEVTSEEIGDNPKKAYLAAAQVELDELEAEEDTYQLPDECQKLKHTYKERELSEQELVDQIAFLDEQIDQAKKRIETNRRGLKLGYLKLANQARRCSHLRNDGKPCRAPAMGNREFCVFHSRSYDCETNQRIEVGFLEDDGSLQLVLKQIMEQLLSGRIEPQTAALLLRGTQIANGVLKARKSTLQQRKPARSTSQRSQRNAEEIAG